MHPPWRVHSLPLYFTQDRFSPSSSKLLILFWFLCFVWRPWIPFNQNLLVAHECYAHLLFASMGLPFLLELIVSRTSTCFILLFMITSLISCSYFLSPFCFWTVAICDSYQPCNYEGCSCQVEVGPPRNFRKKKANWTATGKTSKRYKLILNEIRRFEGGFSLYNTSKISGKLFQINLCVLQLNF